MYIFRTLLFCFLLRDSFYLVVVTPLPFISCSLVQQVWGLLFSRDSSYFVIFWGGRVWRSMGLACLTALFSLPSCSFKYCLK